MDELIEKLKALAGDAWQDAWREPLVKLGKTATEAAVKVAVDGEKAQRLAAAKEAKEAKAKVKGLEAQVEAAGKGDEALQQAQIAQQNMIDLIVKEIQPPNRVEDDVNYPPNDPFGAYNSNDPSDYLGGLPNRFGQRDTWL